MGKHTKPRRNKISKHYVCQRCNKQTTMLGSGRPPKYCSQKCRKPPKPRIKLKGTIMSRGKDAVLRDKLLRGECVLHPTYHQGRRKFVTIENHRMFAYDHIDRSTKKGTIAKLVDSGPRNLETELIKCQLVCHNCHAFRTWVNRDHDYKGHRIDVPVMPSLLDCPEWDVA